MIPGTNYEELSEQLIDHFTITEGQRNNRFVDTGRVVNSEINCQDCARKQNIYLKTCFDGWEPFAPAGVDVEKWLSKGERCALFLPLEGVK